MHVAKWGNSLAVRLPKQLVEALQLKAGDEIVVVEAGPGVVAVARDGAREQALARMRARQWALPDGYRFDREDANER